MQSASRQSRIHHVASWFEDYWPEVLTSVSLILVGLASATISDEVVEWLTPNASWQKVIRNWAVGAFIIGLLLQAVNIFAAAARKKAVSRLTSTISDLRLQLQSLRDENENLQKGEEVLKNSIREVVDGYLASWANGPLGFEGSNEQRVSLYSYDSSGNQFVLVGRFSFNPQFRASRRSVYPADQGCIRDAWNKGSVFENSFPDPQDDLEGYLKAQESYAIPYDLACQMTMRSRLYYGHRVSNQRHQPLAVIVVEALSPAAFDKAKMKRFFNVKEREFISELISTLQPHFIVPSDAARAGM